ncbi:MAG: hypothetical protein AAB255_05780 [Bacteroidota bacterium]
MNYETNILKRFSIVILMIAIMFFLAKNLFITNYLSSISFINADVVLFEKYLFQFIAGFIGLSILSRGQLWSYGINSSEFFVSAKYIIVYGLVGVATNYFRNETNLVFAKQSDLAIHSFVFYVAIPISNIVFYIGLLQNYFEKDFAKHFSKYLFAATLLFILVCFIVENILIIGHELKYFEVIHSELVLVISIFVYQKYKSILIPLLGSVLSYLIVF